MKAKMPGESPMFSQDVADALEQMDRETGGATSGQAFGILLGKQSAQLYALQKAVERLENGTFERIAKLEGRIDAIEMNHERLAGRKDIVMFFGSILYGLAVWAATRFWDQLEKIWNLLLDSPPPPPT